MSNNNNELDEFKTKIAQAQPEATFSLSEVATLVNEIDRLRKFVADYGNSVGQKLDALDEDLTRMEGENARLLHHRDCVLIERNACVGLIARMAQVMGFKTGNRIEADGTMRVVVDLPSGQVSWDYPESEAHLFAELPVYDQAVVVEDIGEKYYKVMNPQI